MSDNIKVVVKVRPLISREIEEKLSLQWRVQNNTLHQLDSNGKDSGIAFTFDKVYDEYTKTTDVFNDVANPIVEAAVAGFNGTIFAYGQTSSGKTFTIVSYIEIYQENLKDLLNEQKKIKILDTYQGGVRVDATEKFTSSPEEVLEIMKEGESNRQTGATNMNDESSRSHSIFQITIESREHVEGQEPTGCVNVSQLNLVDLAGSERAGQTGAKGLRFKEGTMINKSLSVLGLVIKQLSEDPHKHANYRDSKLTRILQNSLGGNAKTSIICAVTPAAIEETISTLQFANRAKAIKNKPEVNAVATDATKLQDLTKQLSKLQSQLESKKNVEQDNYNLTKQIANLQKMILNGFGQSIRPDIGGCRRKTWCAPRRMTISTMDSISDDPVPEIQRFCTPSLKYNPIILANSKEFPSVQKISQLAPVTEENNRMVTPPPRERKVNFTDEIIELDSDEDNNIDTTACSPYHKCFSSSKTPPCVLRKNAKLAEKNLKDIVELTEREKMYSPSTVELMEKLEQSTNTIAKLEDEIKSFNLSQANKDSEMESLKEKITDTENVIKTYVTVKADLEAQCKELNTKFTDLEVSYETLKTRAKLREDELLSLLSESSTNKKSRQNVSGKLSRTLDKDFINFMDMSKDISLVNSDNDSDIDDSKQATVQLQELVNDMSTKISVKDETILKLEKDLSEQKQKVLNLESSCQELQTIINNCNSKLTYSNEENLLLQSTIETLNSTIKNQKETLDATNNDMQSYNVLIQDLQSKLTKKNMVDIIINDELLDSMILNEEKVIANNENIRNIIYSFKLTLDTRSKEIDNLKSALDEKAGSSQENDSIKEQLQAKEDQLTRLIEELNQSKIQLDENISVIKKLMQENEELTQMKQNISEKLDDVQKQSLEYQKHITDLQERNNEYADQLGKSKEENEKMVLSLNEIKCRENEYSQTVESHSLLISNLQSDVNAKENIILTLKNEILQKENIISILGSEDKPVQENLIKYKSALTKLHQIITILTGESFSETEIGDDSIFLNTLFDKLDIVESSAVEVMSQKELAVQNSNKLEIELSATLEKYKTEILKLQSQIDTLLQENNTAKLENETQTQRIIELTNEIEQVRNEIQELNINRLELKAKSTILEEKNVNLFNEITAKESEILTLKQNITNMQSQLETKEQTFKDEIESLKNVIDSKQKTFDSEMEEKEQHLKSEIENLQFAMKSNQETFDKLLESKTDEIICLKDDSLKKEKLLDEKYIELEKLSTAMDGVVQKRDQNLESILKAATCLLHDLAFTSNGFELEFNIFEKILHVFDEIANEVKILQSQKSNTFDESSIELKQRLTDLMEEKSKLEEELSVSQNEHQLLKIEIENIETDKRTLSVNLLASDELLRKLQLELKDKLEIIKNLELSIIEWKNNFETLKNSMQNQMKESQPELYIQYPLKPVVTKNRSDGTSPQSLLTLCCNKVIEAIQPSETDLISASPSSSSYIIENIGTQTSACDCTKLLEERDIISEENIELRAKLELLESDKLSLIQEQEELRKEVELLVEPAKELQKRIISHRTNLSTLTATTYAENKLLKSQVKVLYHHNNRIHSVCQRDIPAFKSLLQELNTILRGTQCHTGKLENTLKRYSLPELLDRNNSVSNFKDESTLDGDLLMLDTNVTLASVDNTILVQDLSCLDSTGAYLDTEINTDLLQTMDPTVLHTQIEILTSENQKLTETLNTLKKDNLTLREEVEKRIECLTPVSKKKDNQMKYDSSLTEKNKNIIENESKENILTCEYCKSKDWAIENDKLVEELRLTSQALSEMEKQKFDFEKKYKDLSAEIISSDNLLQKIHVLEKDHSVKTSTIDVLTKKLKNQNIEFDKLQNEYDVLSTQVMENISEADDLKKELNETKAINSDLLMKINLLEKSVETSGTVNLTNVCPQCNANKGDMHYSPNKSYSKNTPPLHSMLNRSHSESDSSSRINKLSTLQHQLLAGKEDCKTISKEVATIKNHLDRGGISLGMDLDESMGESNIFEFTKDFENVNPQTKEFNMSIKPDDQISEIYSRDKVECLNYYVEKTGMEKENLDQDIKMIDVMKMLYNNLVANHGNEIENLLNKLQIFEESKEQLHVQIENISLEYSKISNDMKEKDNAINRVSNIFSQIRSNTNNINECLVDFEAENHSKLITMFKDNLLNILDVEFNLSSCKIFDDLINLLTNKHQNDLSEIMSKYTDIQQHMERVTSELSVVNENLLKIKCQLAEKEEEYNLLKVKKDKEHEIANAVTMDIVKKDQELSEIISKAYQKLLEYNVITASDVDLTAPANKNIILVLDRLINQLRQNDLVSQEKHSLLLEVTKSKTNLEERGEELVLLKTQNEELKQCNINIKEELEKTTYQLEEQKSLQEQLKEVYNNKLEENNCNIKLMQKYLQELEILKETVVNKDAILQSLQIECSKKQESNDFEVKDRINKLLETISNLENENNDLKSINEIIKYDSAENAVQLEKANETIKKNKNELDQMTNEILTLNQSLKESMQLVESLKLEAKSLLDQNVTLKEQYKEKEELVTQLQINMKTHEKTAEIQSKIINRLQTQKDEITESLSAKEKDAQELLQKYETLQKELTEIKTSKEEIKELKGMNECLEKKVSDLDSQHDNVPKSRMSVGAMGDNARRRRQSLIDSKRMFTDEKQAEEHKKMEAIFSTNANPEDMFMDVDQDSSNRSSPLKNNRRSDSFQVRNEESDKDDESRPSSALERRRRRQSIHDMHRTMNQTPILHNSLDRLDEQNNKSLDTSEKQESVVSKLKERLQSCEQELEELRERYRELDEECETCAQYLHERDEQCMRLKKENTILEQQVVELNEKILNSINRGQLDSKLYVHASVNTDEDWANLHSVVVDRMSFDMEVEKNKTLQRSIEDLRFKNRELKTTLVKMQKSIERTAKNKADIQQLESMKLELHTCKQELEELKERCKELDEECETCGEYLRERDEQVCRLKEAKSLLEAKLQEIQNKEAANIAQSARKKRQSMHDQNRDSGVKHYDVSTQTTEDSSSYQDKSRRISDEAQNRELLQLRPMIAKLTQQKAALEHQIRSLTMAPVPPVYVATGSAIVQNQHLTDVMKENQKLKKVNAKLIDICKKRGKPLSDSNRENDDPSSELG